MAQQVRYAFVKKPRNFAAYGDDAPPEGYIHTWVEEVENTDTAMEEEERLAAQAAALKHLGHTLPW